MGTGPHSLPEADANGVDIDEPATCPVDYVRRQIREIERGLTKVLFGDFNAVVSLAHADPMWGTLAMHVNVVINAARNAIARAEASEREAALARDRALAAACAESRFLTNVTHELRTPLASIRASAEILREFPPDEPEVRWEFLSIIVSESERLTRLIENVLDLNRLQAGQGQWDPRQLHLPDVVEVAVGSLRPLAMNIGAELSLVVEGSLPPTVGDCDGLRQVLVNLISNALKFSRAGDRVQVVTRFAPTEGELIVEVRDQGPGIPEDQLEVVFERFRQVASDMLTEKPRGTGLGLAIAKEIVERHGGRIGVDSKLGVGSVFRVHLPVLQDLEQWNQLPRCAAASRAND